MTARFIPYYRVSTKRQGRSGLGLEAQQMDVLKLIAESGGSEIAHYTEHFLQHTLEERGRYRVVQPDVVLEVAFDTIQASQRHASGYALRFPRILRIRDDKPVSEIDTLAYCRQLAETVAEGWKSSGTSEQLPKSG